MKITSNINMLIENSTLYRIIITEGFYTPIKDMGAQ
jgi:hypothetical protein